MAVPNGLKEALLEGAVDLQNDTVRLLLLDDSQSYFFDRTAHEFVSDVLANGTEATGTGYSRKTLQNPSVTVSGNQGVFDADDVTFSSLDVGAIQTIVIYQQVGADDSTPGDDRVISVYDDDSGTALPSLPLPTNGGQIDIAFDDTGIITLDQ